MNSKPFRSLVISAAALVLALTLHAQTPQIDFPAASPSCTLKQARRSDGYRNRLLPARCQNRTIFGGIKCPYGVVWRTGANQATKIIFSTPVKLGGADIPAGTYALFTIPGESEWTIIINKGAAQWGAFQYKQEDDVARFTVAPLPMAETIETFTIEFNRIRDESAVLNLVWERTVVPIPLKVEVAAKVVPQIEAAMAAPGKKTDAFYFQAATFSYNHHQQLKQALDAGTAGVADNSRIANEMLHLQGADSRQTRGQGR